MAGEDLLLGIDGGQTSTKTLLVRSDGTALGMGTGGPFDHFRMAGGPENNYRSMQTAIDQVFAPDAERRVRAVSLGMTGALRAGDDQIVYDTLASVVLADRAVVQPDYVGNLAGASAGQPGIIIIGGGGAISYGRNAAGQDALAGGYGYLIGDEGSAYDIGKRAIVAATRADDLRGSPTSLLPIVCRHFGVDAIREIVYRVYAAGFSRATISELAPLVVQEAISGDAVSVAIVEESADILATTGLGVARQLFEPGTSVDFYPMGGVFRAGPILTGRFQATLTREWPGAQVRAAEFPPVVGCVVLAAQLVGIAPDAAWLGRLQNSLATLADGQAR